MPVRNEEWILGISLRVALKWCDQVIVCDHGCTDGSRDIMNELGPFGVIVRDDRESGWQEMEQRQMLLETAREYGATHIALIDADEVLTANLLPSIRQAVEVSTPGWMMDLPLLNLREVPGIGDAWWRNEPMPAPLYHSNGVWGNRYPATAFLDPLYHSNGVWGNRWVATGFLDEPHLNWAGDRFHHREPFGYPHWRRAKPVDQGFGGVMHFWGASERRLRAKHALYRITERLKWPTKAAAQIEYTYDPATNPESELARRLNVNGPWTFEALKPEWIDPYAELMRHLHIDAEPWQEAEVRRLLAEHGREHFAGLDLLGL